VDGGSAEINDALSLVLAALGGLHSQLTSDGLGGWQGSAASAFTASRGRDALAAFRLGLQRVLGRARVNHAGPVHSRADHGRLVSVLPPGFVSLRGHVPGRPGRARCRTGRTGGSLRRSARWTRLGHHVLQRCGCISVRVVARIVGDIAHLSTVTGALGCGRDH